MNAVRSSMDMSFISLRVISPLLPSTKNGPTMAPKTLLNINVDLAFSLSSILQSISVINLHQYHEVLTNIPILQDVWYIHPQHPTCNE